MLPATFENNPDLRTTQAVVGIFAVALLTAGFSLTGLLCFAVRNPLFQADSVFIPALTSCSLGLLTIFYNFLVFNRYTWNTPALLTAVAAAVSTVVYAGLLVYTYRKIAKVKANLLPDLAPPIQMSHQHRDSDTTLWQDASYYENYTRNMWPTAHPPNRAPGGYDPDSITEEEMQRQQMLMLLLQKDQPGTADPSASTFHLDWQGRDEDEGASGTPMGGYYAPDNVQTAYPGPSPGLVRQWTGGELRPEQMRPWDGIWRAPARVHNSPYQRAGSYEIRAARRHEIEHGR